jgi:disulfide oxidoreductase YuzD
MPTADETNAGRLDHGFGDGFLLVRRVANRLSVRDARKASAEVVKLEFDECPDSQWERGIPEWLEAAMEEKRPPDPTRRLLRVFGVKVTDYEERTAALLERAAAATERDDMLQLVTEAMELTAEVNARLRDVTTHVLDTQARVMTELRAAIDAKRQ